MIKFFRKIRQKLLTENKFRKYLLYAFGEIVLVVIGILIALQLNNYNDNLKQANLEQKALYNLKLDFEYNMLELNKSIEELKKTKNTCVIILNQTGNKQEKTFDLNSLLELTTSTPQYFPKNGFLMDLINSGKLGIIKNDNLRNKLSSWIPTLETLKDRESQSNEFDNYLVRYIIKNGSWLKSDEMSTNEDLSELKLIKSGFDIDNNNLLKNIEFENMIENQIVFQTELLSRQEKSLELNKEIITILKTEIKK